MGFWVLLTYSDLEQALNGLLTRVVISALVFSCLLSTVL